MRHPEFSRERNSGCLMYYLTLTFNSSHLLVSRDLSRRVFHSGMNSAKPVYIHVVRLFF